MNRYMPKPYRCNLCFHTFDTVTQAEAHWFDVHAHTTLAREVRAASVDTLPKGQDAQQGLAGTEGSAVAATSGETPNGGRNDPRD